MQTKVVVVMGTLAQALRRSGLLLTGLFAIGGVLFAIGYAVDDPGGWKAALIVAAIVAPLVVLTRLAVRAPGTALRWLLVGVFLLFGYTVVELFVDLLDAPVVPIAALVLAVPAAVLGQRDGLRGGELLLLVAAAPLLTVLTRVVGEREGPSLGAALGGSTGVVVMPLVLFAGIFLVAAAVEPKRGGTGRAPATPSHTAGKR